MSLSELVVLQELGSGLPLSEVNQCGRLLSHRADVYFLIGTYLNFALSFLQLLIIISTTLNCNITLY